MVMPCLEETFQ